ncbi:MAG: Maf family protein [Gammaproteobacteria bacterium]
MPRPPQIILASVSPHRRRLLARLRIDFKCVAPRVDETEIPGEPPAARALRLAEEKARAPAAQYPGALILGGDQTISGGGRLFDKPGNAKNAAAQLREMRGKELHFFTAAALYNAKTGALESRLVSHRAVFRNLADREIARYIKAEPSFNCAGGAQIEGLGVSLLESMEGGDPAAVVGMSLIDAAAMLRAQGVKIP